MTARRCGTWETVPPAATREGLLARVAARLLGRPRPGDVVWAPVRYADRPFETKDRPVLVLGRDGGCLLVLTLSSRSKDARFKDWHAIGTGPWDPRRRPSWARLHPYYRLPAGEVRRRGGAVRGEVLALVRRELVTRYGWRLR